MSPNRSAGIFKTMQTRGVPFLAAIGDGVLAAMTFVGECTFILLDVVKRGGRGYLEIGETINQMAFIGAASIPIVALTTFSSGAVISLYSADILVKYGAANLAGATVALSVVREIAPVLAGIMVAARAGSAMAAQIGTMAVTEQLDALTALNVHPTKYLVIPRLVAGVTVLPVLCLLGCYTGILGGYLISVYASSVPHGSFVQSMQQWLEPKDFWGAMLKTAVFGLIVSLVACQQGLRTKNGAVGVGQATTATVVITMVLIYLANFALTWILFK